VRSLAAILSAAMLGSITVVGLPSAGAGAAGSPARAAGTGCVEVQTLTYTRAQDAPDSATQCVLRVALSEAARAIAPGSARPGGPRAVPATTTSDGYPTVGKLTFNADGVLSLNCTGTVINGTDAANNEELMVTAAHCIEGVYDDVPYTSTDLAFSPMWNNGKSPYGTWTVSKVFLNSWMDCPIPLFDCSTNPANDYAIVVLNPQHGKGVGKITGAAGWSVNQPGTVANVTLAGIPETSSDTLTCVSGTTTVTESGDTYRTATTPGFTDGTSGGPWFTGFNATTGLGTLIGDIGGYEGGGPSSGSPSYSSYWNSGFATLVSDGVADEG
jgi:hypothetical protein